MTINAIKISIFCAKAHIMTKCTILLKAIIKIISIIQDKQNSKYQTHI